MSDNFKPLPKKGDKSQIAVALKYDGSESGTPQVTATGRGRIAEQILEIAFAQGVKVREDADLVEILGALDVGDEIPIEAFAAVAEILTYVYRANGQPLPGEDTSPVAAPDAPTQETLVNVPDTPQS